MKLTKIDEVAGRHGAVIGEKKVEFGKTLTFKMLNHQRNNLQFSKQIQCQFVNNYFKMQRKDKVLTIDGVF